MYTTHNQQLHWDVLRRWWLNLSLSLSVFILTFCVLPVLLRNRLYHGKDVGRGLCHGHISHLVHPKTLLLGTLEHAKKGSKNLANTFSDTLAILHFFGEGDKSLLQWQVPLVKLVNLTSWLDKLTCQVSFCPLAPLQITWQVITCQVDLSSQLEQSSYRYKCRILQNWWFWCKTSHFEVLSVHDLLQHLASAGEITKQGKWAYEDLALLTWCWCVRCLLITESPKTPSHYRYQI